MKTWCVRSVRVTADTNVQDGGSLYEKEVVESVAGCGAGSGTG